MIDLSKIDDKVALARGHYSTVRAAHENAKKELVALGTNGMTLLSQLTRNAQPEKGALPDNLADILKQLQSTIEAVIATSTKIESLAKQRAELKKEAW